MYVKYCTYDKNNYINCNGYKFKIYWRLPLRSRRILYIHNDKLIKAYFNKFEVSWNPIVYTLNFSPIM